MSEAIINQRSIPLLQEKLILEKLGLKPFAEYEYEVLCGLAERTKDIPRTQAIKERFRYIGKTTKMLVGLILDCADDRDFKEWFFVSARTYIQVKRLVILFKEMLDKLEIKYELTEDDFHLDNAIVHFRFGFPQHALYDGSFLYKDT